MKNLFLILGIWAISFNLGAQQDIETIVLPLEELIAYAADTHPSESGTQLVVLLESNDSGLDTDDQFYFKQGLSLLAKRLGDEDAVAVFRYGDLNDMLFPLTSDSATIVEAISSYTKIPIGKTGKDGISMGYEYALENAKQGMLTKVIMLRNTAEVSMENIIAKTSGKKKQSEKPNEVVTHPKLGGALALTALTILPEVLEIIKN